MVEQSDRAPLLDWEEIPPSSDPNQAAQSPPEAPKEKDATSGKKTLAPVCLKVTEIGRRNDNSTVTCRPTAVVDDQERSPVGREKLPSYTRAHPIPPIPDLTVKDQWDEKDHIVSVFVVTFNTRSGEQDSAL